MRCQKTLYSWCIGFFEVKDGKIMANAKFTIALKDYDIKIPNAVITSVAETVEITVNVTLETVKK